MSGDRLFPSFGLSLLLKELNRSSDSSTGAEQVATIDLDLITAPSMRKMPIIFGQSRI